MKNCTIKQKGKRWLWFIGLYLVALVSVTLVWWLGHIIVKGLLHI